MCIQKISDNLFPCSTKFSSIIATTLLVLTVASAVLAVIAYLFQWGVIAMASLAAFAGVGFIIACALICCKKESTLEDRVPYPVEKVKGDFTNVIIEEGADRYTVALYQLYALVEKGNIDSFKEAVNLYDADTFTDMCLNRNSIKDPENKNLGVSTTITYGKSLFAVILDLKEEEKLKFLNAILPKIKQINHKTKSFYSSCLEIKDINIIDSILSKMSSDAKRGLIELLVTDKYSQCRDYWYRQGLRMLLDNDNHFLITTLFNSSSKAEDKIKYVTTIFAKSFEEITLNGALVTSQSGVIGFNKEVYRRQITLLHLAISRKEVTLTQLLLATNKLVNQADTHGLTPLMLAIAVENAELVDVLLKNGADHGYYINNKDNFLCPYTKNKMRSEAVCQCPLMVAACLGNKEIYNLLINYGANNQVYDNAKDSSAWKASDYYEKYCS